jgi:hypothetical protein
MSDPSLPVKANKLKGRIQKHQPRASTNTSDTNITPSAKIFNLSIYQLTAQLDNRVYTIELFMLIV